MIGTAAQFGDEAQFYETKTSWLVTKPSGAENEPRIVFELKKKLCERDIQLDEATALVGEGKTALIEDFVSKRGSKFNAHLVLSKTKTKADFEFPPR